MRALALLALAALLAVAACRSIDDGLRLVRAPDLTLVELVLEEGDDAFDEATAVVRLDNPNAWRLAVDVITFEIELNGTHLGRASAGRDVFAAAAGRREIDLLLRYPRTPAIATLRRRPPPRGVGYVVSGTIKIVAPGLDLLPFRLEGRWPEL